MANKEMQDLYIAGEKVTVPAWSTESTLSTVAGYSEATAKALNAMLKSQGKEGNVAKDNNKLFKNMLNSQKTTAAQAEEAAKHAEKSAKNADKASKKELAELKKASDDRAAQLKSFTKSFNDKDLEGMTKVIAGTSMLGVAAGLAVGTVVQFSKDLTEMSNIGVGFGDTLLELKAHSTATGLQLADYGKLIAGNMNGMVALGGTVHEGARIFSGLSRQIRNASSDFHQFGLSNVEMNQVIADEIELRRRSGMQQSLIADSVAGSMNNLMLETSALANITGQDRREVMRARNEAMNDEVTAAFVGTLDDVGKNNALSMASILKPLGAAGETIYKSLLDSQATGIDADAINGGALGRLATLSPEIGRIIGEIEAYTNDNLRNQGTAEFDAGMVALVAKFQNAVGDDERIRLSTVATTNGVQAENARALLGLMQSSSGLNTDAAENEQEFMRTRVEMALSPLIGLTSALEDTVVTMQMATLETVIGGFDTLMARMLGDSDVVGAAGSSIIGALDALTEAYTDTDLIEGSRNLLDKLDLSTLEMAAAAVGLLAWLRSRNGGEGGGRGVGGRLLDGLGVAAAITWGKSAVTRVSRAAVGITRSAVSTVGTATRTAATAAAANAARVANAASLAARETAIRTANAAISTTARVAPAATAAAASRSAQAFAAGSKFLRVLGSLPTLALQAIVTPNTMGNGEMTFTPEQEQEHQRQADIWNSGRADESRESYIYDNESNRPEIAPERAPIIEHTDRIQPGQVRPTETGALETGMTTENAWRHGVRGQEFLEEQRQFDQEQQQRQQGHHYQQETNQLLRRLITTIENN